MKYKVGDRVRVRGDLEVGKRYGNIAFLPGMEKNETFNVLSVSEFGKYGLNDRYSLYYSSEMLRPAEFKIWCETKEEKQAVLEELEKEGYVWYNTKEKPTGKDLPTPIGILIWRADFENDTTITYTKSIKNFDKKEYCQFTPSEFTGIDFSEKIIITKTPTGATAIYGDKTVTTEGDFDDASRQALAEVLCPFKVGDKVYLKANPEIRGEVTEISFDMEVRFSDEIRDVWYEIDELESYTESAYYNAKLFCVKGSDRFKEGHVYKIIDGKFDGEGGTYSSLESINHIFSAKFMEVLDD